MIREHPRFQKTAMIFISAIQLTDIDRLRGYEMGAVDYVPVPVVPEVLRAKVQGVCRTLSQDPPARAAQRRARRPRARPHRRTGSLAPRDCWRASSAAAWRSPPARWARGTGTGSTATGCGTRPVSRFSALDPKTFVVDPIERPDVPAPRRYRCSCARRSPSSQRASNPTRPSSAITRPDGEVRWCVGTAAATLDKGGRVIRGSPASPLTSPSASRPRSGKPAAIRN